MLFDAALGTDREGGYAKSPDKQIYRKASTYSTPWRGGRVSGVQTSGVSSYEGSLQARQLHKHYCVCDYRTDGLSGR